MWPTPIILSLYNTYKVSYGRRPNYISIYGKKKIPSKNARAEHAFEITLHQPEQTAENQHCSEC